MKTPTKLIRVSGDSVHLNRAAFRRGMGKHFPTIEAALTNYKTAEIRAMIAHAAELAGAVS